MGAPMAGPLKAIPFFLSSLMSLVSLFSTMEGDLLVLGMRMEILVASRQSKGQPFFSHVLAVPQRSHKSWPTFRKVFSRVKVELNPL